MEKWICSCGVENEGNFCASCGKPRETVENIPSEDTVLMPAITEQQIQQANMADMEPYPPAHDNYQYNQYNQYNGPMGQENFPKKDRRPLIAGIVILGIVIVGLIMFYVGIESRYMAKVKKADVLTAEIHTVLADINNLDGDVETDKHKAYVKDLEEKQGQLNDVLSSLRSVRVPDKHADFNAKLVEALDLESQILKSVHDVVENPPANGAIPASVSPEFQSSVTNLVNKAKDLTIEELQLDSSMNMPELTQNVNSFLVRFCNVQEQKRIELERKLRMEALQRLDNFRRTLQDENATKRQEAYRENRWIYCANNVTCYNGHLEIDGDFYNGSSQRGNIYTTNLDLDVTLYNQGEVVKQLSSHFGYVSIGWSYMGSSIGHKFSIYDGSISEGLIFDAFDVRARF